MANKTVEKYKLQTSLHSELEWVHLSKMAVSTVAQRDFDEKWANKILADFDPDKMQIPHVSFRDGKYWIMDGQHTIHCLKVFLQKWNDQCVQCRVYKNLTETQEAEMYLALNFRKSADTFTKFRLAVVAGRELETEINNIVSGEGLKISKDEVPGGIKAVGALTTIYKRDGAGSLSRAIRIASSSWGDAGLDGVVINGVGLLCGRYNGNLDEKVVISALSSMRGGVKGLIQAAEMLRIRTGNSKHDCIAASAVSVINRSLPNKKKLPNWWS